jgi:hypothetical protein
MKVTGLTLNKPNLNGRIYPSSVIEKMITDVTQRLTESGIPLERKMSGGVDVSLHDICGAIRNMEIVENDLMCEVDLFEGHKNKSFRYGLNEGLKSGLYHIRLRGLGSFEDDGVTIKDFELISFAITNDPA